MSLTRIFAFLVLLPAAAGAHPHVFIETTLRFVVTDGQLDAVEIHWSYDELYSLLVLEDKGLDDDYDGVLTEPELRRLDGFDMQWVEGYAGDLYIYRDGHALALGPPEPLGTELVAGRIVTKHKRSLTGSASGVTAQAYDPTFYTAYDLAGGVHVTSVQCDVRIEPADLNSAYAALEELLYGLPQSQSEDAFPEVGAQFADTVYITC